MLSEKIFLGSIYGKNYINESPVFSVKLREVYGSIKEFSTDNAGGIKTFKMQSFKEIKGKNSVFVEKIRYF
jgi:hypothetical protein